MSMTFEEEYDPVDIEDYFAHYGRKGMKWYEHIFGRLQAHAKYAKEKRQSKKELRKNMEQKIKKSNYKKLSDEELKSRINRLRSEKEYLELNRATRKAGKRAAAAVLQAIGKGTLRVIEDQTRNAGNKLVGEIISSYLDEKKKDNKK